MLNPKQERFVAAYLTNGGNAKQAAITAGYSARTAEQQGSRLLRHAQVSQAVDKKRAKIANRLEISAERVLAERARLAFFDPAKLLDNTGRPLPFHEIDEDTRRAIQGLEVVNVGNEDVGIGEVLKFKLADKDKSLTALEKHLGLYKESEGSGVLSIVINL